MPHLWVLVGFAVAILAAVLLVIMTAKPYGKGNLVLHVVNEDGETVPRATVNAGGVEGLTTSSGYWDGKVPAGSPLVTVTAPSGVPDPPAYQPYVGPVAVPKDGQHVEEVVLEGWSSLSPWSSLREAVRDLGDGDSAVTITYSFIPPGVAVSSNPPGSSVTITDHVDGSLSTPTFKEQIRDAFTQWKALLEATFSTAQGYPHNLTVHFDETVETSSPPLFGPYEARSGGTGDFRIGMWSMGGSTQVLAYAYGPNNAPSNAAGDILFNSSIDWRVDADVSDGGGDGGFSVLYVAAHEIGHALGFGHHVLPQSLMAPTAGHAYQLHGKFPGGLATSAYERAAAKGIFG